MKVEELKSELDRRMADRAKEGKVFDNSSSMTDEQVWSHLVMFIVPFLVKRRGAGPKIKTSAFQHIKVCVRCSRDVVLGLPMRH